MPFIVTRQAAGRRAARRRPKGLAEIQAAQAQYQQDVLSAQGRLTGSQTTATAEYANLSRQYETNLEKYRADLEAYNQRAEDYAAKVDQYINTINQIESATGTNIGRGLYSMSGMALITREPWLKIMEIAPGHTYTGGGVSFTQDFGGEGSMISTETIPLSQYQARNYTETPYEIVYGYEKVPVPATPEDPGSFTERFDMPAPTAPSAPSFSGAIETFKQESEAAKVRMEREVGERKSASLRARRRMSDRQLLSGV